MLPRPVLLSFLSEKKVSIFSYSFNIKINCGHKSPLAISKLEFVALGGNLWKVILLNHNVEKTKPLSRLIKRKPKYLSNGFGCLVRSDKVVSIA